MISWHGPHVSVASRPTAAYTSKDVRPFTKGSAVRHSLALAHAATDASFAGLTDAGLLGPEDDAATHALWKLHVVALPSWLLRRVAATAIGPLHDWPATRLVFVPVGST